MKCFNKPYILKIDKNCIHRVVCCKLLDANGIFIKLFRKCISTMRSTLTNHKNKYKNMFW